MSQAPEPWQPGEKAEATFARRAGYDTSRATPKFVTSWWWYAVITLQFWARLVQWALGDRHHSSTTGWAIFSLIVVVIGTPVFVINRRKARRQAGAR